MEKRSLAPSFTLFWMTVSFKAKKSRELEILPQLREP